MADYDMASCMKPVLGTAAAAAMQGAVFTPWIDTHDFKAITFLASLSAATQYDAVTWVMQDSDDNGVTSASVAAEDMIIYNPKDQTTTSKVFHAGYRGKKRYVRAALNDGAAATGQITACLSHPMSAPIWQDALEV